MARRQRQGLRRRLVLLGCSGLLLTNGALGCFSFGANSALGAFNFCFLLNCNDGALGGLIDFCAPINFTSFFGGRMENEGDLLADCPDN